MSLELIVGGLYTRTAVARHPWFSWAFLFVFLHMITLIQLEYNYSACSFV